MTVIDSLLILMLLIIFYQDLRYRGISFMVMIILSATIILAGRSHLQVHEMIITGLRNLGILAALLISGILTSLLILRQAGIGAGDIWMMALCSFSMASALLPIFLLTALVVSLVAYLLSRYTDKSWQTIPLAGIVSFCLALIIVADSLSSFDRFDPVAIASLWSK